MTRLRFHTADVFTDRVFGGNPLAVFPDAGSLSPTHMRQIAREFNLSETVFVQPPENPEHTRRLRIFTPKMELPFAGHPTVGAAFVLGVSGEVPLTEAETRLIMEEEAGPVPVLVRAENGRPVFVQLSSAVAPVFGPDPPATPRLAEMLSIDENEIMGGVYAPRAVSCGVPFLFIPVAGRETLAKIRLDTTLWHSLLASFWAPHLYCLAMETGSPAAPIRARMFAPAMGIEEDPATGAAATALGGYLGAGIPETDATLRWTVEQGVEMGRPSILYVEADKRAGSVAEIRVGGTAVPVSEGYLDLPG